MHCSSKQFQQIFNVLLFYKWHEKKNTMKSKKVYTQSDEWICTEQCSSHNVNTWKIIIVKKEKQIVNKRWGDIKNKIKTILRCKMFLKNIFYRSNNFLKISNLFILSLVEQNVNLESACKFLHGAFLAWGQCDSTWLFSNYKSTN